MNVLIVDDDTFICRLLARQLRPLGCRQIVVCEQAAAAVERLEDSLIYPDRVALAEESLPGWLAEWRRRRAELQPAFTDLPTTPAP
ncbi:hypothetical protein NGA35_08480 [Pseudomonas stutzeri]|nr:hypothetical protein [Stutzerimonas stutzeri]